MGRRLRSVELPAVLVTAWEHRIAGPAIRIALLYVVAIEGVVQFVFGRVGVGPLDVGLQSTATPRYIFVNGALIGLLYGLLGMGLILVYRANRIINFAQAQLGSVAAVLALQLILAKGANYFLVLPIVILGSAFLGGATDVLVMRRFRSAPRLIATVATIGVSLLLVFLELFLGTSLVPTPSPSTAVNRSAMNPTGTASMITNAAVVAESDVIASPRSPRPGSGPRLLVPGREAPVERPPGVPEPPVDANGSVFRWLFDTPTAATVEVVAGSDFAEGEGDQVVTPEPPEVPGLGPAEPAPSTGPDFTAGPPSPPVEAPAEAAAPALEPQDLAPSVPDLDRSVRAAAGSSSANRTVGFVLLALAALAAAWSYWSSPRAEPAAIGLGRFRTTLPAGAGGVPGSGGQAEVVGGLSRFARPRRSPPTPLS